MGRFTPIGDYYRPPVEVPAEPECEWPSDRCEWCDGVLSYLNTCSKCDDVLALTVVERIAPTQVML